MNILKSIFGGGSSDEASLDINDRIDRLLKENPGDGINYRIENRLEQCESGRQILALNLEQQALVAEALIARLRKQDQKILAFIAALPTLHQQYNPHHEPGWSQLWQVRRLMYDALCELPLRKLPLGLKGFTAMAEWGADVRAMTTPHYPLADLTAGVEGLAKKGELDSKIKQALNVVLKKLRENHQYKDLRKFADRIEKAIGQAPEIPIVPGEVWSNTAIADLSKLPPSLQAAWAELLGLCRSSNGAQPSGKWLVSARKVLDNLLAKEEFKNTVLKWFPLVDKPRTEEMLAQLSRPVPPLYICDQNADILRGLAWICGLFDDREIARAVTDLALTSYKKIPGTGPRLVRVGNACVYALGAMPGMEGVGKMALLRVKVKFGTAQKMLDKALGVVAKRLSLPVEELEEMAVPAYGLSEVGHAVFTFDDITAELNVPNSKTTEIVWKNAAGKVQKSVPAKVKIDFSEDLKELKSAEKDIQKMLPAQVERIDQLYLQQKEWPIEVWRERYLDHPLVGVIARRLIWRFHSGGQIHDAIWKDGALRERDGQEIVPASGAKVTLWHPLDVKLDEVTAWRHWLEDGRIRQPFKQAHREVYLLTPAEETTRTYSNRFAAHIIKQHQFNALAGQRGWKNKLRLMVDDTYPPASILLPKWNLRAEYWIEGAGSDYGTDTNDSGTYLYLITDQVRFYPIDSAQRQAHAGGGGYAPSYRNAEPDEPIEVSQIPPLVFSEVMRDVDLFVGVASVGNDPNWNDGGPRGRYVDYWQKFSFGELTATAQTRKAILERLVPRLKIAAQCSLEDKFLVVRGQIRTYKIHLGSGNIQMSPNDQYLCIVQGRSAVTGEKQDIFLPFEGDGIMAVILSKAFLLAADSKIADETIVRQIRPA